MPTEIMQKIIFQKYKMPPIFKSNLTLQLNFHFSSNNKNADSKFKTDDEILRENKKQELIKETTGSTNYIKILLPVIL